MLRLVLALAVIVTHTEQPILGIWSVGGAQAVEVFFIVSGFYMAMILTEKYKGPGSFRVFIVNRFLRLMPTYWLVAVLAALVSALLLWTGHRDDPAGYFQGYSGVLTPGTWAYLVVTNALLLGQDASLFLRITVSGTLAFTQDFGKTTPELWHFMLVPQAWSIALELSFYAIAPLVVRARTRYVAGLLAASLLLRAGMYAVGWRNDPWNYRFFPNELALFLAGVLAYRLYARYAGAMEARRPILLALTGAVVLLTLALPGAGGWNLATQWGYYALMALAVPAAFAATKHSRLGRLVGELSYPVYMWHWLVITVVEATLGDSPFKSLEVAAVTLLLSGLTVRYLILPLDRVRQGRVLAEVPARSPVPAGNVVPFPGPRGPLATTRRGEPFQEAPPARARRAAGAGR